MKEILKKEIADCLIALSHPNSSVDNYRCYYEGRMRLAEELLLKQDESDKQQQGYSADDMEAFARKMCLEQRHLCAEACLKDGSIVHAGEAATVARHAAYPKFDLTQYKSKQ